jgi:hypothetical protein
MDNQILKYDKSLKFHNVTLDYSSSIIEKSNEGGYRIYKDVTVLTPGKWSDMITNSPVLYKSDILRKHFTSWSDRYVNLGHSHYPLDYVGTFRDEYFDNGVKGDLYINPNTSNGRDIINKIDSKEINLLSVEMQSEDYWDSEQMMRCADNIEFLGVSIIGPFPGPACKDSRIQ